MLRRLAGGKAASAREWQGSTHALAELPYHLTQAERWDDLFAVLTDFTYLEAKVKRVAVTTGFGPESAAVYNGVLDLIGARGEHRPAWAQRPADS